ncbi:MAG: non-ribosomal peptide synthetase, partial [Streptosporangiaceae bacterium]|nr:non-ribosomal peptide synthetase [Streptosporangiaceae bacterium]
MNDSNVAARIGQDPREDLIQRRLAGQHAGRRPVIPAADRSVALPLSSGQRQMWFLNRLAPDSGEYLVPFALRLSGMLDIGALSGAWNAILARHEILRTRYRLDGAEPVQVIDPPGEQALTITEVPGPPGAGMSARAAELVEHDSMRGFDLEREWPVRARLLRLTADEHVLVVVFHHIACDQWSVGVFAEEMGELYTALSSGERPRLPPLPIQYADYAAWERSRISGDVLDRHLRYWRSELDGLAALQMPVDRPRPPVRDWRGASVPLTLPAELARGIPKLAAACGVTVFTFVLSAFQVLLHRYTGSTDIPVGTVVSGRSQPEFRRLIGYGINSLVLRGRWTGDPVFTDLLAANRVAVLDAFDHQEFPFARLVDELQPERDMSRTPLYQVALNMHQTTLNPDLLNGVQVEPFRTPWRVSKVDLTLHIEQTPDGIGGRLEYATSLFEQATAEQMARHLVLLLSQAADRPGARISQLDLFDKAEREVLVGGPAVVVPVSGCVHELFEEHAARVPGAVAVVCGDVVVSYRELN